MRKKPHLFGVFVLVFLFSVTQFSSPVSAQPLGWSGDENFAFQLTVNGISAVESDLQHPIPVNVSSDLSIELRILTLSNLTLKSGLFVMQYLSIPIINQPFDFNMILPAGINVTRMNSTIPLSALLGEGGLDLISGTVIGTFSFVYSLLTDPATNVTVSEDFVLQIGTVGPAALFSVSGLITVGFTILSVFGLLLSLDDFQQGILAARKLRGAKKDSEVGIFPSAVILRRKPKKGGEKIDKEELIRRVQKAASTSWDGKRCPKCGKKWKKAADNCSKCKLSLSEARDYFAKDIAKHAPKALKIVSPKAKVPVGKFTKRLKLPPDKGGALAAALTDMGIFQTKSVKVPLKKVSLSGMTLAGTYWSWMQIFGGATPSFIDVFLTTVGGLVVSVIVAYLMNWLARVPKLGYK